MILVLLIYRQWLAAYQQMNSVDNKTDPMIYLTESNNKNAHHL